MELLHAGKVREVWADGDDLLLVATDRISVFDVVLPTPIPDKGAILTQLSLWWFDRLGDVAPHHVLSASDVPAEWAGRAVRCRRLTMLPVEAIARGYLAGSAVADYAATGAVQGVPLPPGLVEGSALPSPVFTPTTKEPAGSGRHDAPLQPGEDAALLGEDVAAEVRRLTLEVYRRGAELAAERGVVVADTKLEFGHDREGRLLLGDELLTPDSSRFWPREGWSPGGSQPSFDKQYVRDWAASTGWDRTSPGPQVPDEVVERTRERYVAAYERITGRRWS
ncbi:MAG TPA: phosphoribosylaminoimidazolesuccinocarboxamide synthase [Kineosporiaceae bacterium]|jgi:phosphoribosylaminoimidazole-succinocarboxamide synthase|nr:phosphoribosylaminoimidazolesuccinocarboxamide synthase [Kineosporiaceae bacterium]